MDSVITEIMANIVEYAPAVAILVWVAWRADARAQECIDKLIEHLDKEH